MKNNQFQMIRTIISHIEGACVYGPPRIIFTEKFKLPGAGWFNDQGTIREENTLHPNEITISIVEGGIHIKRNEKYVMHLDLNGFIDYQITDQELKIKYKGCYDSCTQERGYQEFSLSLQYISGADIERLRSLMEKTDSWKKNNSFEQEKSGCIVIPDSVTEIENEAFLGCTNVTSIVIPESVKKIGGCAFQGCRSLASIIIPDSVTEIGNSAFEGCTSLSSIAIPDSVTEIGDGVFEGCTNLASIIIPDSVTIMGECAFKDCTSLTSIVIPNSVTEIGKHAFHGCTGLTSIVIPNSVTVIGQYAFNCCIGLTSVIIPESVMKIRGYAFIGCSSLTSIFIPDSVMEIGWHPFEGCDSLKSVLLPKRFEKGVDFPNHTEVEYY